MLSPSLSLLLVFSSAALWSSSEALPRYRVVRGMVGHASRGYAVAGPRNRVLGFPTRMGRIGGVVDPFGGFGDGAFLDSGPRATARIGSSMASAGNVAAGVSPDGVPWVSF